jgi:hypothetical protein
MVGFLEIFHEKIFQNEKEIKENEAKMTQNDP